MREQARGELDDEAGHAEPAVEDHELVGGTAHFGASQHLAALSATLAAVDPFEAGAIEAAVRSLAEARGVKAGVLIHAARVAVTGRTVSPGIFEVLELVGRDDTIARIADALS